jgi:hypothetical protein
MVHPPARFVPAGRRVEPVQGSRRITTRGVPDDAFDVVGAATVNPARSNIAAVPVYTDADEIRSPPVETG